MDKPIEKLDKYTELTLVNHWKQIVQETKEYSFNNSCEDDDWILVNYPK